MKRRLFALVALVSLLLGISGCSQTAALPDKVVVTYVKAPLNVPSMVERDQGIFSKAFAEDGISVEYTEITSGADQTQALASGDVQFLFAVGSASVILAAANGADIRVIGAYSSSPKAFQIVTGDDSIQTAADLKGKVVAGPKGTTLHELLAAYLTDNGLSLSDVDFVSMSIGDAQAALEAGQIDAALLAGANAYSATQSGYRVLADGEGLIDGTVLVATSGDFYDKYPQLVERFQSAHREILDVIQQDPDQALEIAARETGMDRQAVEAMYAMYDFHAELTDADLQSIQKTIQFMKSTGMIEQDAVTEMGIPLPEQ